MTPNTLAYLFAGCLAVSSAPACLAASEESSTAKVGCVTLAAPDPEAINYRSVLIRELFRQAFLLAARDELLLTTRDAVLREDAPADAAFNVKVRLVGPGFNLAVSVHQEDENGAALWSGEKFRVVNYNPLDYRFLATRSGEYSRQIFPEVLKKVGLTGAKPKRSAQTIPPAIEKQLGSLNVVDQYAAIRSLHELVRNKGQSPDLLGGLVRGYAHLSILSQAHWNVSHRVFLARSLLYTDRMIAAYPNDPSARAHMAYAFALGGMHAAALEDCSEARRLAQTKKLPPWLDMIEAVCKFDNKKLEQLAATQTPVGDLACLMRLLQCESVAMSDVDCSLAGFLIRRQPYCLRVLHLVSELGPISQQHISTNAALALLDEMIRLRAAGVPGLPQQAALAVKAMKSLDQEEELSDTSDWRLKRVEAYRGFLQAGVPDQDRGEPSWAVLGRLLEEEFFVVAVRRALFIKTVLCIEASDEVEFFSAFVKEHPYRNFLELCGILAAEEKGALVKLMGNMVVPDPDIQMDPMLRAIYRATVRQRDQQASTGKPQRALSIYGRLRSTSDGSSREFVPELNWSNPQLVADNARELLKISPHHPVAAAKIVQNDWASVEPQLADWEDRFGGHPEFARAMAKHYQDAGPPEMAEKYTLKLIELAPDPSHYSDLATLYEQRNETGKFVNTLVKALTLPETGLVHSRIRARLADHYMDQGDYKTALPYAEEAAESGAADCLLCLSRCYEGMGDMKGAEALVREYAEHYRTSGEDWFLWCKRTGQGDVEAARRLAEECLAARDIDRPGAGTSYGVYLVLTGEPRQAMQMFLKDFELKWNPTSGLHGALLAFKMGDRKLFDQVLQNILDKSILDKTFAEIRAPKIELARLLQDAARPGSSLDQKLVDAVVEKATEGEAVVVEYFAGRFFEAFGDESLAREYLLRAARSKYNGRHEHTLAVDRCRQSGLKITAEPGNAAPR